VLPTHTDVRSKGALLVAGVVLATLSAPSARAQQQQQQQQRHQQAVVALGLALAPYAIIKDSAHLPDGRTIHLVCMGHGSPVVILAAGGGDWSDSW
jgi:hypothetical protein